VRVELGGELAAEMFAQVVFVSDGLLQVNDTTTPSPAARFFSIVKRLPLELQMLLCFRQVGSAKEIIPSTGFHEIGQEAHVVINLHQQLAATLTLTSLLSFFFFSLLSK